MSRRVLVVSHRSFELGGGAAARWRSLSRYLPDHGWEVDVVSAASAAHAAEFDTSPEARQLLARRARVMGVVGQAARPVAGVLGVRADALAPSMAWAPRGAREARARLEAQRYDVMLATGPPAAGLVAGRRAHQTGGPPFVAEFRDLWAGSPAFDRRGGVLGAVESWVLRPAARVIACTPEAVADLRRRHPGLSERVVEVPNGFEPSLLERRADASRAPGRPIRILHSGALTEDRPLTPLLRALAQPELSGEFSLALHGFLSAATESEIASTPVPIEVLAPSGWDDAVARIAAADVALVTQARGAGDATAVASKVYEYLALGRPVLCLTDGGATEALLGRLGADRFCARLGDPEGIAAALRRLREELPVEPVAADLLDRYSRRRIAERMADVLESVAIAS